jgi:hypothetical protein
MLRSGLWLDHTAVGCPVHQSHCLFHLCVWLTGTSASCICPVFLFGTCPLVMVCSCVCLHWTRAPVCFCVLTAPAVWQTQWIGCEQVDRWMWSEHPGPSIKSLVSFSTINPSFGHFLGLLLPSVEAPRPTHSLFTHAQSYFSPSHCFFVRG